MRERKDLQNYIIRHKNRTRQRISGQPLILSTNQKNSMKTKDNLVEWCEQHGEKDPIATIETSNDSRLYRKLSKYFDDRDDIELVAINEDGTTLIHVPVSWIKITPPRYVSDHLRQTARERRKRILAEQKWDNLFRQRSNNANEQ